MEEFEQTQVLLTTKYSNSIVLLQATAMPKCSVQGQPSTFRSSTHIEQVISICYFTTGFIRY